MSRGSDTIDQKLKRAGALALTFWTVLLLPTGLGLVLLGVSTRIEHREWQEPLSIGVGLVAVGAITWYLSRRLHEGARQVRARMDENRILRLASQRGGRAGWERVGRHFCSLKNFVTSRSASFAQPCAAAAPRVGGAR